jgi:hypothetical protein
MMRDFLLSTSVYLPSSPKTAQLLADFLTESIRLQKFPEYLPDEIPKFLHHSLGQA